MTDLDWRLLGAAVLGWAAVSAILKRLNYIGKLLDERLPKAPPEPTEDD
jgi:hypothetical protein